MSTSVAAAADSQTIAIQWNVTKDDAIAKPVLMMDNATITETIIKLCIKTQILRA